VFYILSDKPDNSDTGEKSEKNEKNEKNDRSEADRSRKKRGKNQKAESKWKWIITVFIASFIITVVFSALSESIELSSGHSFAMAFGILIFFITVGVTFDMVGLAIATADEKQFHSMAARKIKSAKHAIKLIRNAEKVSSFCNDVIGDIAGIVSGATGAAIAAALFMRMDESDYRSIIGNFLITGLIAAVTVGGKAFGKGIAINFNNDIVNIVSKIISFFSNIGKFEKKEKNGRTEKDGKSK
jgi:heme/copper-type cytochrome/quinol oxidase subunit 4